jgi:chromosome partitioning protein
MRTIAITSGKGGAGKTSLVTHLAAEFALQGRHVLVVDLDPTGHLTTWLLGAGSPPTKGTAEALLGETIAPGHLMPVPGRERLTLLPSTPLYRARISPWQ